MAILVTGATGTVGSEVVSLLLKKGESVTVLSRSLDKATARFPGVRVVQGDLTSLAGNPAAFEHADRMVLITPLSPTEAEEGIAAVNAAVESGVCQIAFQSVHNAEIGPDIPHFKSKLEIEAALESSGCHFTVVMPNNFYQNDLHFQQVIQEFGIYPQPLGPVGTNRVDVRDIAEALVNSLLEPGHESSRYPLVGPDVLTGEKTAEVWASALGRPVRYAGDDLDLWAAQAGRMLPEWLVADLRLMYGRFIEKGLLAMEREFESQKRILHHPPRRFEDFAAETARHWKK